MRSSRWAFAVASVLAFVTANSAHAVVVSSRVPIATHALSTSAAFDGTNYLVGMQGDSVTDWDVGAKLVSPSGAVGPLISTGRSGGAPGVAFAGSNYLLAWTDTTAYPRNDDVYGQVVDLSGNRVGNAFPVAEGPGSQALSAVGSDGTSFLVVWGDQCNQRMPGQRTCASQYAQFVAASGSLLGPPILISSSGAYDVEREMAVAFGKDNFLLAWAGWQRGTGLWDLYGRFITTTEALSDPIMLSETSSSAPHAGGVVAFDGQNYLVAWNSDADHSRSRLISPSGAFLGPEFATGIAGSALAFDGANYLVTRTDTGNDANHNSACDPGEGTCWDVYGRFMSRTGTLIGSEFPITTDPANQFAYSVVFGVGQFLVVWTTGDFPTQAPFDVYAAFVSPLGGCVGDCSGDRTVTVDEILTMVNIALGNLPATECLTGDANGDHQITVDEILQAVNNALNGCPAPAALSGTVATGGPVIGAAVQVKDRNGTVRNATTDGNGKYTADVTGLTGPFLLRVGLNDSALFSVAEETGVANITPLTDLIVKNFYRVGNTTAGAAFDAFNSATPVPAPAAVHILSEAVVEVFELWLANAGIDAASFDPITTPFDANGTGVDRVLGMTSEAADGSSVTVHDAATNITQNTTFAVDPAADALTVSTTTTSPTATSSGMASTLVPVSTQLLDALAGVSAALARIREALNKGDILPELPPDFLLGGEDRATFAACAANEFGGSTILSLEVTRTVSYDDANKVMVVRAPFVISAGGVTNQIDLFELRFEKVDEEWYWYGDRRLAWIEFDNENRAEDEEGFDQAINIDVSAPVGMISSVTVKCGAKVTQLVKDTSIRVECIQEEVFLWGFSEVFPPGTRCDVTVTPVSGSSDTYLVFTSATTTDTITLSGPTGHCLDDARLGQQQTVCWTLPTTFAVKTVLFGGATDSVAGSCHVDVSGIGPATTCASITLPQTCQGQPAQRAYYKINVIGPGGEHIHLGYNFGSCVTSTSKVEAGGS
jgi:hypothetical protein